MATLKELRLAKGLSQIALAAEADCSNVTICNAEQGKTIRKNTLKSIAKVLGVTLDQIEGVIVSDFNPHKKRRASC